ncbi:DinB family protein [Catalinimonas sp. 4WD22]|uniref:DinB family protein n=1 Tax=Catalinimonas locisalis TaxID=3133978 RepID=UPI003100B2EF
MKEIAYTRKGRENFMKLLDALDEHALNHIPPGFNNNIIWNFGHIIATQQIICYKLSGLEMHVDLELIDSYRRGTKPNGHVSGEEIEKLKALAISTIEQLQQDFEAQRFQQYHEYTTSFGVTLSDIQEGIRFNAMHESLHLGYAMALRRVIMKEMKPAQ